MATIADVRVALDRARGFVAATPLPSGEVPIDFMHTGIPGRERVSAWCTNCFATMFACHALAEESSPVARTIIERARPFLEGELIPPGIWNYFAEGGTPAPAGSAGPAGVLSLAGGGAFESRWSGQQGRWPSGAGSGGPRRAGGAGGRDCVALPSAGARSRDTCG
ncbi:MAG: hypothetical protein IPN47_06090 [Gemmatimonadetes bacterium]|nr:hypothetical protein [Gemmatimonadota bacterium]